MLTGFPCIQCYDWQYCHTLFDQTSSDRWRTHTETEVCCFTHSDAFSSEIHSASCELKENYETQRDERYIVVCIFFLIILVLILGDEARLLLTQLLAGVPILSYTEKPDLLQCHGVCQANIFCELRNITLPFIYLLRFSFVFCAKLLCICVLRDGSGLKK